MVGFLFVFELFCGKINHMKKPEVVRQTVIINDDYVRKNRRGDGKVSLILGGATRGNKILLYDYVIDKNITLMDAPEIEDTKRRLAHVDRDDIIAHEAQHIHNRAIGYNYLANSDNIYECMMLTLADEISAQMAGYLHKTKNIDDALNSTIQNMSPVMRQYYISGQFANHFALLQKTWGEHKNLYEYKYDGKKIARVVDWYFTIDGQNIMRQMSKETRLRFNAFILEIQGEIRDFIRGHVAQMQNFNGGRA